MNRLGAIAPPDGWSSRRMLRFCKEGGGSREEHSDQTSLVGCSGLLIDSLEMRAGRIVADAKPLGRTNDRFAAHQKLCEV